MLSLLLLLVPADGVNLDTGRPFHFVNDVIPLFSRHACNASGCHGKAEGQNGFKLSVFGFDSAGDYAALVKEARGRGYQRLFLETGSTEEFAAALRLYEREGFSISEPFGGYPPSARRLRSRLLTSYPTGSRSSMCMLKIRRDCCMPFRAASFNSACRSMRPGFRLGRNSIRWLTCSTSRTGMEPRSRTKPAWRPSARPSRRISICSGTSRWLGPRAYRQDQQHNRT